ncbi:formyltetrahydrofolate deformylase [Paeniglutamicibacter gangotriensis]|uniref:formyltetrahydrofolate deformylase n=1 Tax=Paeniglutamicibacter gangotriensis TaxID=254787 RepID=UPI0037CBD609
MITIAGHAEQSLRSVEKLSEQGRLLVKGEDKPGIVAAVASILREFGANIMSLDQYSTDPESGNFFQRTEFHLEGFQAMRPELESALEERLTRGFGMEWKLHSSSQLKRVAIFASKSDHCLLDLLWRHRRGELPMNVTMVISNHSDLAEDVRQFGIPFVHVPVDKQDRTAAERRHLELLQGNVDLIVLARYMQIITPDFLERIGCPVINIHHSFLPAFIGAAPYRRAKERGVKLIGATAHYVTEELDEGPIIEQDVVRVSHVESPEELARSGADVERQVLSRAVAWHCSDRVMSNGNSTVVL